MSFYTELSIYSWMKKIMTKWIAIILGVLLISTNSYWVYMAIDLAVTEKYRQQEEYEMKNIIEAQTKLNHYFVNGMPKEN